MTQPSDPVGERLRDLTTPPSVGDPLDRVLARSRRDSRRRTALSTTAAVLAVSSLALGVSVLDDRSSSPPAESGVVPWKVRFAPQNAGGPPPDGSTAPGPGCAAEDLRATASEPRELPAEKNARPARVEVDVLITNDGPSCGLMAQAAGDLLAEGGSVLPLAENVGFSGPGFADPPPLEKGATASTTVTWSSSCEQEPGRWSIALRIGGDTVTFAPPGAAPPVPGCEFPSGGKGAVYGFGTWTVLNEFGQPARDPRGALVSTVTVPESVRMLEPLRIVLRVTNPSRGPVALDPCPVLGFSVSESGPGSFHSAGPPMLLNCPDAPDAIPAGGHVDFALELLMSPALVDGRLAPGDWYVTTGGPGQAEDTMRRVTVLPPAAQPTTAKATCDWVPAADGEPRTPGVPASSAPRSPAREAVLVTNRGEVTIALDPVASPCAVQSFLHHVRGGYWQEQRCALLSAYKTFRHLDCGPVDGRPDRAGFLFPAEVPLGTTYPEGTVVLASSGTWTHTGSLRILYGAAPTYLQTFTVLGRVTSGLEIFKEVAAGGQKNGEYAGPKLPLTIESVRLDD